MRVPLVYPKIPGPKNCPLKKCIAFEKLDGTNIHWKWNADIGLHKGKIGNIAWHVDRLRDLADALEEYNDDSFVLSDIQDYHDWKNK